MTGVGPDQPRPAGTLAGLAGHLAGAGDERRRRLVLDFVERYAEAPAERRPALLADESPATGGARWDALLGALAEHLATEDGNAAPAWSGEPRRFLEEPWYWVDLPSVRRHAGHGAPEAFRRRNAWVDRADLQRV